MNPFGKPQSSRRVIGPFSYLMSLMTRERPSPVERVTYGATLPEREPAPAPVVVAYSKPLPPCQPLNANERGEADTMARLRGALYPSEA